MAESALDHDQFFEQSKRGRGRVKHAILKYYLGGYFGAVGQSGYQRLIFIDGFSGPGQYQTEDGSIEEGSPLIAYKTVAEHHFFERLPQILFIFIEENESYKKQLMDNIVELENIYQDKVDKIKSVVFCGNFETVMKQILKTEDYFYDPMLIFVDPFGIKGIPMKLMKEFVERPRTELFINIMFSTINRWYGNPKLNKLFNQLLGEENSEWKKTVFNEERPKSDDFIKYYVEKLSVASSFDHIFAMKDQRNRNIYQLVFVTKHLTGLKSMKRAMNNCSQQTDHFIYSEWLQDKIEQGLEPKLMSKQQIQTDVVSRIRESYQGQQVFGHQIGLFVWCETPYIFNLKRELKREFKDYIISNNIKFDEIIFKFPS